MLVDSGYSWRDTRYSPCRGVRRILYDRPCRPGSYLVALNEVGPSGRLPWDLVRSVVEMKDFYDTNISTATFVTGNVLNPYSPICTLP